MGENDKSLQRRSMVFRVCVRSAFGAALLGLFIGTVLYLRPDVHPIFFATVGSAIGGALIGLYSSTAIWLNLLTLRLSLPILLNR